MRTQGTVTPEANTAPAFANAALGRSTTDPIESEAPDFKAKMSRMVDSGKTRVTEWKGTLQGGIREKPIQSVLIAAAVGAAIGVIFGRRSR